MKVVLVIPTYNERDNVEPLVRQLESEFLKIRHHEFVLLFVDDNSPDGTAEAIRLSMTQYDNLAILSGTKEGLGRAYLRGIDHAVKNMGAEAIVQMDGDLSHDPKDIGRLLEKIDGGFDLALGSRYIKGGSIPRDWAWYRKVFSVVGNMVVRFLTGTLEVHEFTTSLRAYRTDLYARMDRSRFDFADNTFLPAFVVEAKRVGAKICEVPVNFSDRQKGQSKIDVFSYAPNLLRFCLSTLLTKFGITNKLKREVEKKPADGPK